MNVSLKPSKVEIVLVVAGLAGISVLSLATVALLGAAVSTGWIVAGAMSLALAVLMIVIFREVRQATELPDYLAEVELSLHSVAAARQRSSASEVPDRSEVGNRGLTAGSYDRIMPRRARARQNRPRTSSWT